MPEDRMIIGSITDPKVRKKLREAGPPEPVEWVMEEERDLER